MSLPRLQVRGDAFQTEDGNHWPWAMMSGFRDYDLFRAGGEGALKPVLDEARELRSTGRRVFFAVNSFAHIWPTQDPDFYTRLPDFFALEAEYKQYVEATHGDLQIVLPSFSLQQAHFARMLDAARAAGNVLTEFCNEVDNNGLDKNAPLHVDRSGVVCSLGSSLSGGPCPLPSLDYAGSHLRRDGGGGMYADICPMFMQQGYTGYPGVGRIPVPHNETIGAAEVDVPGRRSTDTNMFFKMARMASAWNGMTFHSDCGVQSQRLAPVQRACAEAFFVGIF